jgi:glutamate dehydrogenase/leucine dehydrogenase
MTIQVAPVRQTSVDPTYQTALSQYDHASTYLTNVPDGLIEYMRWPRRELTVNFPVRMDDGSVKVFTGYRIHHNTVRVKAGFATAHMLIRMKSARWQCG